MGQRVRNTFVTAILAIIAFMVIPSDVARAIDLPDNMQIITARVYRNLVEDGDFLVVYHGKINYDSDNGTYPTTPASSTILLRMVADNGTLLAAAAPYVYSPFETNGYGNFVSSFYFDADTAPTWGVEHTINISGLPAYYSPVPTPINYPLQLSDYDVSEDQDTNRADLYIEIIRLADVFKGIYPDVSLKSVTDVGTVLSAYGEAYFKSSILGLDDLCPSLFYVQVYTPETIPVEEYDTSLAGTMAGHTTGSDLERGMNRMGEHIGVAGSFMWGILTFAMTIFFCIYSNRRAWGIEPGIALSTLMVILVAVLIGDFMFNLMMIISLLAAVGIMFVYFLRRA